MEGVSEFVHSIRYFGEAFVLTGALFKFFRELSEFYQVIYYNLQGLKLQ
jgi:hypothetical protein